MILQQSISLLPYNTFGIDVPAEYLAEVKDTTDLHAISRSPDLPDQRHTLGGGSNILLTQPVRGLVLLNKLKGISVEKVDAEDVWLRVASGEIWHELVMYAINNNLGGIENLALIPGTVGAAPIQNIGAYGVEAKETIDSVAGWHWEKQKFVTYSNEECGFGYRNSIFKHELKDQVFITSVVFRLSRQHHFNTSYGAISHELERMQVREVTIKTIAEAVIAIRTSKLPDPKKIGNAGSFFKNPTITVAQYNDLRGQHPTIPSYAVDDDYLKIPAGWMIEQCGWKGWRKGDEGVHEKQALVLVNYGHASGAEILQLSLDIRASVKERFHIDLETEVQIW